MGLTEARFKDLFKELIEIEFARFFGQMTAYIDNRLEAELTPIRQDIHQIYDILDGISGRMDDDDIEGAALTHQVNRHHRWIGELSDYTGAKLSAP